MTRWHWPGFDPRRQLSGEEATELAARMAELAKAGLPLGPGLRALGGELSQRRLRRVLDALADRLDAGEELAQAIESHGWRLPASLRGAMLAGVRSGHLAEVLEEFADLQRSQAELRRRIVLSLAYPLVLLLFMAALLVMADLLIIGQFHKIFMDFGVSLPALTRVTFLLAAPLMWFALGLLGLAAAMPLVLWLAPGVSWIWPALYRLPMLGPLLRWSHLAHFARLMGLLLEQEVALPDALRLSAAGLRDGALARGCLGVAEDIERGESLDVSMAARRPFPASLIPIVAWGLRAPALADAFRAAAEMFEGRTRSQGTLMDAVLLPIVFLAVITSVGLFVVAMFLPLIQLIQRLT